MTANGRFTRPGPLAFPITVFHADGSLDPEGYRDHLRWLLGYEPAALFVGCGTGEFASLTPDEVGQLVAIAVDQVGSDVPVYAGAGHGVALARASARGALEAGAAGLLVFPPDLADASQDGLFAYFADLATTVRLPLIAYQRGAAVFEPDLVERLAALPQVVGIKDGAGDIERMQRLVAAGRDRLTYFNGMPTAETVQPAYSAIGVELYSSAVFNFAPEISWAFYRALAASDATTLQRLLAEFFLPLAHLRRQGRGYAVTLVKAGVALRGHAAASVRPPLVEAPREHLAALREILDRGLAVVGA